MKIDEFFDSIDPNQLGDDEPTTDTLEDTPPPPPPKKEEDKPTEQKEEKPQEKADRPPQKSAKEELIELIADFTQALDKKDIAASMQAYAELKYASHKLIELEDHERKTIYEQIVSADNLLSKKLEQIEAESQKTIEQLKTMVRDAQGLTFKQALNTYQSAKKLLTTIPDVAADLKQEAQTYLIQLYVDLLQDKHQAEKKIMAQAHARIMDDIVKARHHLQSNQYKEAKEIYKKSLDLYNHLPHGFLKEKALLYRTVIALFNEIGYGEKMATLQHLMTHTKSTAPSMDGYLLRARTSLRDGNKELARKDIDTVLRHDPHNPQALALQKQLISNIDDKALYSKLQRIHYEVAHGQRETAMKEITQLSQQYPKDSRIAVLKQKLEKRQPTNGKGTA